MKRKVFLLIFTVLLAFTGQRSYSAGANMTDYCYVPPTMSTFVPPNVMIMLSIETPMQGTAHPPIVCTGDPRTSYNCTFRTDCSYVVNWRRVDNCYNNNKTYYGYFDPNKCYAYVGTGSDGRFEPIGPATNHQCSGSWSGNFLNWATTMAVDAFRKAMTGGNRIVDLPGNTILLGARQTPSGNWWFPIKRIDNAQLYTPYTGTIYLIRYANGFVVCRDTNSDGLPDCDVGESGIGENLFPTVSGPGAVAAFNLKIKVCDPSKGLEPNCNPSNNKPEGVIQKYADKMRFGLISYALYNNPDPRRDGGVIRANMKWISPKIPYGMKYHDANGDLVVCNNPAGCPNPEAEINADGTFITNPDNIPGARYSGVINYINKFGYYDGYKQYDPISEMYYEIIRYFKKLGPSTDNYCTGLPTIDDGAPVYCSFSPWSRTNRLGWRDPYIYPCQKSFVVAINDANPWLDKRIPGTAKTSDTPCRTCVGDFGAPSNADTSINVSYWTDLVGNYEGLTPGYLCVGCVLGGICDWNPTQKYVTQLSKAFGTCAWTPKENSYYIAGLAYYAHQTDLRPDLPGNQTLKTYMIDTQEPNQYMLVGRANMLYLAAKFGNFDDTNGNGRPDLTSEWDKDNDGFPDAYFFASDPTKIEEGLNRAFADILSRASSGATVATLTSRTGISSLIVQPYYYPQYIRRDGTEVSWLGFFRAFWIDIRQNLREDTTSPKVLNIAGTVFDKIFQFFFDPNNNEAKVAILRDSDITTSCVMEGTKSINQVIPVFDAGCQLANRDPSDRKILYNKDGTLASFTISEASYFRNIWKVCSNDPTVLCTNDGDCDGGTCQPVDASCIIRYLRGEDNPCNYPYVRRTRTVEVGGSDGFCSAVGMSGNKVWKLGDIINSTPSVVSSEPLNIYHLRYNDTTYLQYIRTDAYKNRTSFMFVGANDGMLHAFRVGRLVQTGDPDRPTRVVNAHNTMSNDLVGREEWAFIPRNALPYLVWYGNPNYCRVPTVDYRTVIFDASINGPANADKTVSSWRTILLGTMGFGGKSITTRAGTFSSSVFALDLTDWLNGIRPQPTLLWEVRLPDGTLTTSFPAVVRLGDPNKNGEWYVVIGSGPLNPEGTSFTSQPKLYFIDLRTGRIVREVNIPAPGGVSFAVGDIAVVDVDNDYQDDVIYFGVYGKTSTGVWGNFYRLSLRSGNGYKTVSSLTQSDVCTAIDFGTFATGGNTPPVFGAPNFTKDENGKLWVFFGTGRYVMDNSDKAISYDNYLIGFKDENWNSGTCPTPYTRAQLTDVTNQPLTITITEVRQLCMCDAGGCGMRNVVYDAYSSSMPPEPTRGWYYRLPGEAIYSQPLVIGGIVDALTYVPPEDICQMEGKSNLISVYYKTGRPYPRPSVLSPGAVSGTIAVGQSAQLLQKIPVGQGIPPIGNPFQALQSSQASQQLEKFAQVSSAEVLRLTQQKATTSEEKFLLWIEK
ncbi:pilus assembly protein [Thermocrinis sp.]|jgi:Tfp pilus tip-associated adhesin PilY1|uniref:pilus assembly protein n=1 Tax=Thermocrinis sp. TaxID=2024383 RepID=UPI003C026642